jgi:hypothetical protein
VASVRHVPMVAVRAPMAVNQASAVVMETGCRAEWRPGFVQPV